MRAAGGVAAACVGALFRARLISLVVLSLILLLAVANLRTMPWAVAPGIAICFAAAWLYLRHGGLAVLTAVLPMAGFAVFALPLRLAPIELSAASLCYGVGFVVAMYLAGDIAGRVADGADATSAAHAALTRAMPALAAFALGTILFLAVPMLAMRSSVAAMGVTIIADLLSIAAVIGVALGASLLRFGEEFIARANRTREWLRRLMQFALPVAGPRYGLSVLGIGIVFLVLGIFGPSGARPLAVNMGVVIGLAIFLAIAGFGATFLALRDWRRAFGVACAILPAAMIGERLFLHASAGPAVLGVALQFVVIALALAMAGDAPSEIATDAELTVYLERALEKRAPVAGFAVAAIALASIAVFWPFGLAPAALGTVIFAGASAVLLAPAGAIVIETFAPRPGTRQIRYRVR